MAWKSHLLLEQIHRQGAGQHPFESWHLGQCYPRVPLSYATGSILAAEKGLIPGAVVWEQVIGRDGDSVS